MAVSVRQLVGNEIPERFRQPGLHTVWAVFKNGELRRFCVSEAEANALAQSLDDGSGSPPPAPARKRPGGGGGPGMR